MSVTEATIAEQIPVGAWKIDPVHSSVEFQIKHTGIATVRGRFTGIAGTLVGGDEPTLAGTIQVATVDTGDEQRDTHLASPDFFDVETHPKLAFRSTKVDGRDDEWTLEGELTVAGVTRPVVLDVTYEGVAADPWGGTRAGFTATAQINREDFGLSWNAALEAGGFLVGKTVTIDLDVELIKV
jgi:polyisoprenoid-binding protein YceI